MGISSPAIERISLDHLGNEITTGVVLPPKISSDGTFAVFSTNAALIPTDTDSNYDIYIRDLNTGILQRLSETPAGGDSDGTSDSPAISANGQFVAFRSDATNLLGAGVDTNGIADIFVRDVISGTTTRVSVATGGGQSTAFFGSGSPSITGDGRYVAFSSLANDLVAGDTNNNEDIFLHDRNTTSTVRLNLGPMAAEANSGSSYPVIAENGSVVVFRSFATNLVPGVNSGNSNVFGRDLMTNTTFLVSKNTIGGEPNFDCLFPDVSADGNLVVYESLATDLSPLDNNMDSDIYLYDRMADQTTLITINSGGTKANGNSAAASISGDGSVVGFTTLASNLLTEPVDAISDIYVKDLGTGTIRRITVGLNNAAPDQSSYFEPDFTHDGSAIVFESPAGNLVPGDTNMTHDNFIEILARVQPDNLLSKNSTIGTAIGNDVYNTSGAGQKLTLVSKKAKTVNAYLFVQNDGENPDMFTLQGPDGNRFFDLKYFLGPNNETAAIKAGVFLTDSINPGNHTDFRITCKPSRKHLKKTKRVKKRKKTIWLKKNYTAKITSTSSADPNAKDTAALLIKHK